MSDASLADRVDSITDSATKNVEELSGATKDFVESNNLVTKFVFILGVLLNTDLVPTKNFPSLGSVPQNIAGDPSHLIVRLNFLGLDDFATCERFLKNSTAFKAPALPWNKAKSSRCVR